MTADWAMVLITFVYVVATCFICYFNHQSAKASREQLAEMKKQFDEENRPIIEVEFIYERRTWYGIRFVNHGRRTAQDVSIQLSQAFIDSLPKENIRSLLSKQKDKKCIIGVGQHYDLYIGGNELRGNPNMVPATGLIVYQSDGKKYSRDISVDLDNYMTFFSIDNDHDDLMKVLKEGTCELKRISAAIDNQNTRNDDDGIEDCSKEDE